MKIVIIGDTHCCHEDLGELSGDVLIHCGDMFDFLIEPDDAMELMDDWFARQQFDRILCVGGNHDITLEGEMNFDPQPFQNARCLQDERVDYGGLVFYGAPWVPYLQDHAFYQSGPELEMSWKKIPADVDILITHTPPENILDRSGSGKNYGCPYLADALIHLSPRVHCFGHVHASAGSIHKGGTRFINASMVNSRLEIVNAPYVLNL